MDTGDRHEIPSVADAVGRATALCDPDGTDTAVQALYSGFEDDERPATAAEDLAGELQRTLEAVDADGDSPGARMAVATAVWLATNPDRADDREHVLREAARLHFHGDPPEEVGAWLAERKVSV